MKKRSAVLLLCALFISCEKRSNSGGTLSGKPTAAEKSSTEQNYLITEKSAGAITIGDPIPEALKGYTIEKESIEAEEGEVLQLFAVKENGRRILTISAGDDSAKIGSITVESDRYRTADGAGVGVSIDSFIRVHPDYSLWYTYVSDMYVLETPAFSGQFLLDSAGFIGKKDILFESDRCDLKLSDFSSDTKITGVRLF